MTVPILKGAYGDQLMPLPEKPRLTPAQPRRLDVEQLLAKMHWTADTLEFATSTFGFPTAGRRISPYGRLTLLWNEATVDKWIAETRASYERLQL